MKFTIAKKDLVRSFSVAEGAVEKKPPIPILGNVKIVANGALTFEGTDTMIGAKSTTTAKIDAKGSALVPAAQFLAAARAMPEGDVTVRVDGARVELAGGKARQRVAFTPADDYPPFAKAPNDSIEVDAAALNEAIGCVAFAASADETRANLAGVKVTIGGGRIRAVATNSHTLAMRDVESDAEGFDAFLPIQSLREVRKALASASGSVGLAMEPGMVFVTTGDTVLSVKLTEDSFPPFEKLIPTDPKHRPVVNREALLDAFKRVMVAADNVEAAAEVTIEDGTIRMRMDSAKGEASASDEVSCDYAGKGITFGIRGAYSILALSTLASDEIAIEVTTPKYPVLFVPANGGGHIQLVMPSSL